MITGTSINHIYVIADATREPNHIQYLQSTFKEEGLEEYVTYFQPTWKTTLSEDLLVTYCPKNESKHNRPLSLGEISLFINYILLFESILETYDNGYFIIFESDIRFEMNIRPYIEAIQIFLSEKNPDALSIGSGCDIIHDDINTEDMNFQIYPSQKIRCTDSYIFSYNGIQKFISYIYKYLKESPNKSIDEPIDNFFQSFLTLVKYDHYWAWPSLTLQGSQNGHYKSSIQENIT